MGKKITRVPFERNGNSVTFNFKNGKTISITLLPICEEGVMWDSLGRNSPKKDFFWEVQTIFQMASNEVKVSVFDISNMENITEDFTKYEHAYSAEEFVELLYRVGKS